VEAPLALVLALVGVRGAWGSATEDTSVFVTSALHNRQRHVSKSQRKLVNKAHVESLKRFNIQIHRH
jgi:hypothetical protein